MTSKYREKVRRWRGQPRRSQEPEDDYSVIPSPDLRKYFRARAGMYGMVTRSYKTMRVDVSPSVFKKLLRGHRTKVRVAINTQTAEPLGELAREVLRLGRHPNIHLYSTPFGGRMHAKVMNTIETHSPGVELPELTLYVFGFGATSRALRMEWVREGLSAPSL